eukprot:CAMPEP_0197671850 /NCGR_PEP_ID=MMETSP1338-20131121/77580_1 /TAXON_ID=43686 ORGANISM="Pelagodinium beii, Strain RCC1491" /NCGR_SAMPLE_ID=MMETSP1338 /ASSEMBLY_ACC=CAM_ASM_000754 /LENGTH=187 /DNA_ID=CAMNT_0043251831 /DNA_START=114 /DNA_END=674 /DNA_ORIENTATION=+
MGLFCSKMRMRLKYYQEAQMRREEMKVFLIGLDGAGKTTILYRLKLDEDVTNPSDVGFNVESIEYQDVQFTFWDGSGRSDMRPLWRHYYCGFHGIIFVVDCSDKQRAELAHEEFAKMLGNEEIQNQDVVVLVYANKTDLPDAMTVEDVTKLLELEKCKLRWKILGSCGTDGTGLWEGVEWLFSTKAW